MTIEIVLVLLFVVCFEFSLGPIVWIYMSEVMTDKGVSVGTVVNWLITILMALLTPILLDAISGALFIIFGGFCAVCAVVVLMFVKETKGLSNAEVGELYSREKKKYGELEEAATAHED